MSDYDSDLRDDFAGGIDDETLLFESQGASPSQSFTASNTSNGYASDLRGDFVSLNPVDTSGRILIDEVEKTIVIQEASLPGPQGAQGLKGDKGDKGDSVIGPQGPTGATGQGFSFRGAWMPQTNYFPYDVVTYGGSSYVSNAAIKSGSVMNLSNWTALAVKGDTGYSQTSVVDYLTIDSNAFSSKQVVLSQNPVNPQNVYVCADGGPIQKLNVDFQMNGNILSWLGFGLETILQVGDNLVVGYQY